MKTKFFIAVAFLLVIATSSCTKGDPGDLGSKGEAGTNGAAGIKGATALTGATGVYYSDWFSPGTNTTVTTIAALRVSTIFILPLKSPRRSSTKAPYWFMPIFLGTIPTSGLLAK